MEYPMKGLRSDSSRYKKSYQHFHKFTNEHERIRDFFNNQLPKIFERIVDGKSHINVIGLGSGTGVLDLEMFSVLHQKFPKVTVDNEAVDPNLQQLNEYRGSVSKTPDLEYINFNWNTMTASEFEKRWKETKMTKKVDLVHMLQMLYYVKDFGDIISFYISLLDKNGKLLIDLLIGESGWVKMQKKYGKKIHDESTDMKAEIIKSYLDSKGMSYKTYKLPFYIDITACFTEWDEEGELMLDFLTHALNFSKTAPPQLKAEVLEFLRHECSVETDGKVLMTNNSEVIVVDQST